MADTFGVGARIEFLGPAAAPAAGPAAVGLGTRVAYRPAGSPRTSPPPQQAPPRDFPPTPRSSNSSRSTGHAPWAHGYGFGSAASSKSTPPAGSPQKDPQSPGDRPMYSPIAPSGGSTATHPVSLEGSLLDRCALGVQGIGRLQRGGGAAAAAARPGLSAKAAATARVADFRKASADHRSAAELNLGGGLLDSSAAWDHVFTPSAQGGAGAGEAAREAPRLQSINLSGARCTDRRHFAALAAALRARADGLEELNFSGATLGERGSEGVADLISAARGVATLRLDGCRLQRTGIVSRIAQVLRGLPRESRVLRTADLGGLCGVVPAATEWVELLGALSAYTNLQHVRLAGNLVGPLALKNVALLFGGIPSLRCCDVSDTGHDAEGRKWLFDALARRIADGLRQQEAALILDDGVPVDAGWTELQYAAIAADHVALPALLGRNATEVYRRDTHGRTIIHLCAAGGDPRCLQAVLRDLGMRFREEESGIIVNFEDRYSASALAEAASRCHLQCARQLLAAGAAVTAHSFEAALRLHIEHADCISREHDRKAQASAAPAGPGQQSGPPLPEPLGRAGALPTRLVSLRNSAEFGLGSGSGSNGGSSPPPGSPTGRQRRDSQWQRYRASAGVHGRHEDCDKARAAVWEQLKELSPHAHGPLRSVALRLFLPGFVFHVAFLLVLTVVAAGHSTRFEAENYSMSKGFRDKLQGTESLGAHNDESLPDMSAISTIPELWHWTGMVLLNVVQEAAEDDSFGVVGGLRMRQVRVRNGTCEGQKRTTWHTQSSKCYGRFSEQAADRSAMQRTLSDGRSVEWLWEEIPEPVAVSSELGQYYGPDGYVEVLPVDPGKARRRLELLREADWVDDATRALFIDLTFFQRDNAENTACHFLFELPQGSRVHPSLEVVSIRSRRRQELGLEFHLFETLLSLFTVFLAISEVHDLFEMRQRERRRRALQLESQDPRMRLAERCMRKLVRQTGVFLSATTRHLCQSWNALDYTILLLLCAAIWQRNSLSIAEKSLEAQDGFVSFNSLSVCTRELRDILGVLVALAWIKSLKFMVILPVVGPTVDAIVATVVNTNILSFLIIFLVISTSLSLGLHFTLGNNTEDFASPSNAALSFFRMVFGDFNVHHFTAHTSVMGEILFVTCLISANFILLNILIAVVGHEYDEQLRIHNGFWQERMIAWYEKTLRLQLRGGSGNWAALAVAQFLPAWTRWAAEPSSQVLDRYAFATAHYVIDREAVEQLSRDRDAPTVQTLSEQLAALGAPRGRGRVVPALQVSSLRSAPGAAAPAAPPPHAPTSSDTPPDSSTRPLDPASTEGNSSRSPLSPGSTGRWQSDKQCSRCNGCRAEFSVTLRRHHCRGCGLIFCAQCSSKKRRVPGEGRQPVRVCDACFASAAQQRQPLPAARSATN
eukprot:TRINITY_DN2207_c0_g1_i2.p1 TRINITY_DN2207_c0_g1~~TRINITY_DN2207_c0_g1_i2.p1  ORF type:complete len:1428 (+),score=432.20 TRINITY_DN2207_c0_g1_i2:66-4286(+)